MPAWIVVTIIVLVTGAAVIATLFGEQRQPLPPRDSRVPRQPIRPGDLRRVRFPLRFRGYDPVLVDQWLVAAADALDVLGHTAGPDLVALADEQFLDDGESVTDLVVPTASDDSPAPATTWPATDPESPDSDEPLDADDESE